MRVRIKSRKEDGTVEYWKAPLTGVTLSREQAHIYDCSKLNDREHVNYAVKVGGKSMVLELLP